MSTAIALKTTGTRSGTSKDEGMRPFAQKIIQLMLLDPATHIKKTLDICQTYAPLGFDRLKKLVELQERNIGALQEVAMQESELTEKLFARQRAFVSFAFADAWTAYGNTSSTGTPLDMVAQEAARLKKLSTRGFDDLNESGKDFAETQKNVAKIVFDRIEDFTMDLKEFFALGPTKH